MAIGQDGHKIEQGWQVETLQGGQFSQPPLLHRVVHIWKGQTWLPRSEVFPEVTSELHLLHQNLLLSLPGTHAEASCEVKLEGTTSMHHAPASPAHKLGAAGWVLSLLGPWFLRLGMG